MIKSSIEKLAEEIGFDIGMSDDQTQAKLLNGFSRALCNSIGVDNIGSQLTYIVDKLDSKSHTIIKELAEFIKLKENEN